MLLAVPQKYQEGLDLHEVAKVFPYGDVRFELQGRCNETSYITCDYSISYCVQEFFSNFLSSPAHQDGGMVAPSGIAIEKLGDINDDMVVVCASVTVGK